MVVLFFMLVATAMALENKSANENFTNQNEFGSKLTGPDSNPDVGKPKGGIIPPVGLPWGGMFKMS